MRCLPLFATSVAIALSPALAAADYTTAAPVRPLTMSDPAGLTVVGLDVRYTTWTEPLDVDVASLAIDVTADIALAPHWVIFARMPMTDASIENDPILGECCDLALGNFTLGGRGLWSTMFGADSRAVVGGELAISLPTASDEGTRAASAAAAAFAELPHDAGLYAPNTTTFRLGGLSQFYSRWFLAHAVAGLQLYLYDGDIPGDDSSDVAVRLGLAAGFRATHTIAILAELNANMFLSDLPGDETATSVDLGVRYGSNRAIIGLRAYIPLDAELRDLDMLGFGLDAGVRF